MAELNAEYFAQLVSGIPENIGEIANSFSSCFEEKFRFEQRETGNWIGEVPIAGGEGSGLLVAFRLENRGFVVAIPETFPLPEWYKAPGDNQSARLQTLALEWSMNMLPTDREVSEFVTIAVSSIREAIDVTQPDADAQFVVLEGTREESASSASGKICLIGPVAIPPVPSLNPAKKTPLHAPATGGEPSNRSSGLVKKRASPFDRTETPSALPTGRPNRKPSPLLGLPVQVVVLLAEKKIELGGLLALSPGSLVSFDKSCDALLDLYVNNQLYCRGEAIKIGEHFGLKVNEVQPRPMRAKKVL